MTKEIRASELELGDIYREFGDDATRVIKHIGWHGDRVLVTTDEDLETSHDTDEVVELVTRLDRGVSPRGCQHCGRIVYRNFDLVWIDPEAGYDDEDGDGMWRETCDAHDSVTAEHEPKTLTCKVCSEGVALADGVWFHPHSGDKECWTGDGSTAYPIGVTA